MSIESVLSHEPPATAPVRRPAPTTQSRLTDLRMGELAEIVGTDPGLEETTARRLMDLGFVSGAQVGVLRRAPMGDPVILRVAGYEVALRKAQTKSIRVRRLS